MNKVVTIHLDGREYSLEEAAYDALRAYLDAAKLTLLQNPDKDEIIKDLEQAIGAKFNSYLNPHKNVVTKLDVDTVLLEMGPVSAEGGTTSEGESDKSSGTTSRKRLYRINEGRWIAGVCTGLAEYFNLDVALVRIVFVVLTFLTHGFMGLVYIILMIIVPAARTPKDFESAAGMPPVTAQELVDRARKGFEDFANSSEWQTWHANWKTNSRAWKAQHRAWKHAQKQNWKYQHHPRSQSFLSELNGFIWSMFGLLIMLFVLWYLYHHVQLIQQFIDFLHTTWDSLFQAITNALPKE
ncbi:MAG: phage shock protein PspC [Candidatus Kaiserbacteria bacterium]|nr:phage shock protein PspC [Candidatus Kaiserbacteria bacterium]